MMEATTIVNAFASAINEAIKSAVTEEVAKQAGEIITRLAAVEADVRSLYCKVDDLPSMTPANLTAKIKDIVEERIDEALDSHCASYDHDDFVSKGDIAEEVEDAVGDIDFSDKLSDFLRNTEFTATLKA